VAGCKARAGSGGELHTLGKTEIMFEAKEQEDWKE
jgi:hypothetical protein